MFQQFYVQVISDNSSKSDEIFLIPHKVIRVKNDITITPNFVKLHLGSCLNKIILYCIVLTQIDFVECILLFQQKLPVKLPVCCYDRFVTLVFPSGKITHSHKHQVAVSVELYHTYHRRSGVTSTSVERSNLTSTALAFCSGN